MKATLFEELLGSVREGGAILRGEKNASRRFAVQAAGVRAIREGTSLSQSEFAGLIVASVKTPQNWEQDRRPQAEPLQTANSPSTQAHPDTTAPRRSVPCEPPPLPRRFQWRRCKNTGR